jgi:hypothetical protein
LRTHRQRNATAWQINFEHAHGDLLANLEHFAWVFDELRTQLRHMHQAIVVHAEIDERAERGNVADQTFKHHAGLEIINGRDIFAELWWIKRSAWVAAWFAQFRSDIAQRSFANSATRIDVFRQIDLINQLLIANQRRYFDAELARHLFNNRVALWVNCRRIQRIGTAANAQKASSLFKRFRAQASNRQQLAAGCKRAIGITMRNDLFR